MKTNLANIISCTALAVILAGCSQNPTGSDAKALAEVNGRPITEEHFRFHWDQKGRPDNSPEARAKALDELVLRRGLVARALAAGLDRDPAVAAEIESLLIAKLREQEVHPRIAAVDITESEARAFYEKHKNERFAVPERRKVAVLWYATRRQAPLEARYRPRLEAIREELLKSPDTMAVAHGFGELAISHSEHRASRYQGGIIGWIGSNNNLDPWKAQVSQLAESLSELGEVSPVVANEQGIFLVRLISHQASGVREFAAVKAEIRNELEAAKRAAINQKFQTTIPDDLAVRRFPERLDTLADLPVTEPTDKSSFPTNLFTHTN